MFWVFFLLVFFFLQLTCVFISHEYSAIILNVSLIFCYIFIIGFISYFTLEFYNLQPEAYTINDVSMDIICEFILRSVMLFDINSQIHTLMLLYINSQLHVMLKEMIKSFLLDVTRTSFQRRGWVSRYTSPWHTYT